MKSKYSIVTKLPSKVKLIYLSMYLFIFLFLGKSSVDLEDSSTKTLELKAPRIKEVLKERKVLEKKVALSKRRRKDSRYIFICCVLIVTLVVYFQKRALNVVIGCLKK